MQFKFLRLCDNHTRYVYGAPLEGLKPGGPSLDSLKKAFARILKRSPQWAIIRVDRDPAITALKLRTLLRNISYCKLEEAQSTWPTSNISLEP